jgi:hypothetical protein
MPEQPRPTLEYRTTPEPVRDPYDQALDRFELWSMIGFITVVIIFAAVSGIFVHLYLH